MQRNQIVELQRVPASVGRSGRSGAEVALVAAQHQRHQRLPAHTTAVSHMPHLRRHASCSVIATPLQHLRVYSSGLAALDPNPKASKADSEETDRLDAGRVDLGRGHLRQVRARDVLDDAQARELSGARGGPDDDVSVGDCHTCDACQLRDMAWHLQRQIACRRLPSLRSVLAVMPSQKMLTPPATIGIEAVSVVFICRGSSPLFGVPDAVGSSAFTTKSTKMLLLRSLEAWPRHSTGQHAAQRVHRTQCAGRIYLPVKHLGAERDVEGNKRIRDRARARAHGGLGTAVLFDAVVKDALGHAPDR
eukprot:1676320-Rhodomonas_salina.1